MEIFVSFSGETWENWNGTSYLCETHVSMTRPNLSSSRLQKRKNKIWEGYKHYIPSSVSIYNIGRKDHHQQQWITITIKPISTNREPWDVLFGDNEYEFPGRLGEKRKRFHAGTKQFGQADTICNIVHCLPRREYSRLSREHKMWAPVMQKMCTWDWMGW